MKTSKKTTLHGKALQNWPSLNDALRSATKTEALELLVFEQAGQRRVQYLLRIYGRYNLLRAKEERAELLKSSGLK